MTPIEGVGHDYIKSMSETVNPATGSLSLRIQLPSAPGRGAQPPFSYTYDSSLIYNFEPSTGFAWWTAIQQNYDPVSGKGGWGDTTPVAIAGLLSEPQWYRTGACFNGSGMMCNSTCTYVTNYVFKDAFGVVHQLDVGYQQNGVTEGCTSSQAPTGNDTQVSAVLNLSGCLSPTCPLPQLTVTDWDGDTYTLTGGLMSQTSALYTLVSMEDRNGNMLLQPGHDSLGRNPMGIRPYSEAWTTTAANYSLNTKVILDSQEIPNEVCDLNVNVSGTSPEVSTIQLPNGQQYAFYYGSNNADPSYDNPYGMLNEIDYPSGMRVRYKWGMTTDMSGLAIFDGVVHNSTPDGQADSQVPQGCMDQYSKPVVTYREVSYVGSSTPVLWQSFQYRTTWDSSGKWWNGKTTTVTTSDPIQGTSNTVYTYVGAYTVGAQPYEYFVAGSETPVEASILKYDWNGSSLLSAEYKNWTNLTQMTCDLNVPQGGQVAGSFYQYQYGQITDEKTYDYGQIPAPISACPTGGPNSPARETATTLQTFTGIAGNIFARPHLMVTSDPSGPIAETDYNFDEQPVSAASAVDHDDANYSAAFNARGNPTTKTVKCRVLGSACTDQVTKYVYDDTGQVLSLTEPCGITACSDMSGTTHTVTVSYADNFTRLSNHQNVPYTPPSPTNAYVTSITNAAGQRSTFAYDFNSGELVSATDPNGQTATYVYDDLFDRATSATAPDTGNTSIVYNDAPYSAGGGTPSVKTTKAINAGQNASSMAVGDGMGHVIRTSVTDAQGTDITDMTYTGTGLLNTRSNPYRAGDTGYGFISNSYDALGRHLLQCNPDNGTAPGACAAGSSYLQWVYSANTITAYDELRNASQQKIDGLGRLQQVTELGPGLVTKYSYDVLGNLWNVTQLGNGSGDIPRVRSFTYDSLSRLVCSSNPESSSSPCPATSGATLPGSGAILYSYDVNGNLSSKVDARGVATSFTYDNLNRVITKTYSNAPAGSLSSCYRYDGARNGIGRLYLEWTTPGFCTTTAGYRTLRTFVAYDVMGRLQNEQQCVSGSCSSSPQPPCPSSSNAAPYYLTYCYDLAGNMTWLSNGVTNVPGVGSLGFTRNIDGTNRLSSVISTWNDTAHPQNLFTVGTSNGYTAAGALGNFNLGNHILVNRYYDSRLRVIGEAATPQ